MPIIWIWRSVLHDSYVVCFHRRVISLRYIIDKIPRWLPETIISTFAQNNDGRRRNRIQWHNIIFANNYTRKLFLCLVYGFLDKKSSWKMNEIYSRNCNRWKIQNDRQKSIKCLVIYYLHNNEEDCFEVWNLSLKVWEFNGNKYTPI